MLESDYEKRTLASVGGRSQEQTPGETQGRCCVRTVLEGQVPGASAELTGPGDWSDGGHGRAQGVCQACDKHVG